MLPRLARIVVYTRRINEMIAFYGRHFGYSAEETEGDRIVELVPPQGGAILMLHPASTGQKAGQSAIKLVFDVPDVASFVARAAGEGLHFGPLHKGDGYLFANAKDPAGNSISVSSRAFAGKAL